MAGMDRAQSDKIQGKTLLEKTLVVSMKMDERTWAKHANPWSVWTRFTCLPAITLAIWSRQWLEIWFVVPLTAALLWTWLNPRIFAAPEFFDSWASKVTFGERVWLNRSNVPIPAHHGRAALITSILVVPGIIAMIYGLAMLQIWPTVLGTALAMMSKIWFCDRMVWLYQDMSKKNAVYASWIQRPGNDNGAKRAA